VHTGCQMPKSGHRPPVCAVLSGVKTDGAALRDSAPSFDCPSLRQPRGSEIWMIVPRLIIGRNRCIPLAPGSGYKRMFAYSTVEHMGNHPHAAGFATTRLDFGAVSQDAQTTPSQSLWCSRGGYHSVASVHEKSFRPWTLPSLAIRGLRNWSLFLAIRAAPPFPIFLSEYAILFCQV